jgi:group I intron endonuclease
MIGIYKITSPTGKVYIGQSVNLEKRQREYAALRNCKGQIKLHNSLIKHGFSEHIFEVVEECSIEVLNRRERHWQDFYDVLSEKGLNCKLTKTEDRSGKMSEESRSRKSDSLKAFYKTPEGKELKIMQAAARRVFNKTQEGIESIAKRVSGIDMKARTANTDYVARTANTNWATRFTNTSWVARSKNNSKAVLQFYKDQTFAKEWPSVKEAGEALNIDRGNISSCLAGRCKSVGGFIWKYK